MPGSSERWYVCTREEKFKREADGEGGKVGKDIRGSLQIPPAVSTSMTTYISFFYCTTCRRRRPSSCVHLNISLDATGDLCSITDTIDPQKIAE